MSSPRLLLNRHASRIMHASGSHRWTRAFADRVAPYSARWLRNLILASQHIIQADRWWGIRPKVVRSLARPSRRHVQRASAALEKSCSECWWAGLSSLWLLLPRKPRPKAWPKCSRLHQHVTRGLQSIHADHRRRGRRDQCHHVGDRHHEHRLPGPGRCLRGRTAERSA